MDFELSLNKVQQHRPEAAPLHSRMLQYDWGKRDFFFNKKVGIDKNSTTQHLNESNNEQKNLQL